VGRGRERRSQKNSKEKNGCQFYESEWERKKEIDKAHHMTTFSLCQLSNFLIENKGGEDQSGVHRMT
jgi:hypothetical protein